MLVKLGYGNYGRFIRPEHHFLMKRRAKVALKALLYFWLALERVKLKTQVAAWPDTEWWCTLSVPSFPNRNIPVLWAGSTGCGKSYWVWHKEGLSNSKRVYIPWIYEPFCLACRLTAFLCAQQCLLTNFVVHAAFQVTYWGPALSLLHLGVVMQNLVP